jgi:uncharacterized protein (DUF486 family)
MKSENRSQHGKVSTHPRAKVATIVAARVAAAVLLFSFVLVPFGWGQTLKDHLYGVKLLQVIVLSFWTVSIPIWFWVEFHWIGTTFESLEELKYSQELSSKIWLACTSVLFLLYFGKDIR